jgi:hypothetical protein
VGTGGLRAAAASVADAGMYDRGTVTSVEPDGIITHVELLGGAEVIGERWALWPEPFQVGDPVYVVPPRDRESGDPYLVLGRIGPPRYGTALRSNSADGGTDGAVVTVANSGGASGDAWTWAAGEIPESYLTFSAEAITGALAYRIDLMVPNSIGVMDWWFEDSPQERLYGRFTMRLGSGPQGVEGFSDLGFSREIWAGLNTVEVGGVLTARLTLGDQTGTVPIPMDAPARVEFLFDRPADTRTLRLWLDPSSHGSPDETLTASYGDDEPITFVAFELWDTGNAPPGSLGLSEMYLDDIAIGIDGPLGPP